jgi:hypothetical protein
MSASQQAPEDARARLRTAQDALMRSRSINFNTKDDDKDADSDVKSDRSKIPGPIAPAVQYSPIHGSL